MTHNLFNTQQSLSLSGGRTATYYSLPQLESEGIGPISRLPVSIRIVLESVLRNCDGRRITENDVRTLANWSATGERTDEVPFVVARVVLQDFTGVPLLVDLAAMRSAVDRMGKDPGLIEPLVPVDLVVDHSVQVDYFGTSDALQRNMEIEFERNRARYEFLKWGMQAFESFSVVPPGIGIVHQVNLEYLAKSVVERDGVMFPDSVVGTDSHTTMINGLGIVGWGVGGIEAEAAMLGQPVYFLTPDVVGVDLTGRLADGVTATDLVLTVTEMLRKAKVVGKFVEFHGSGAASLSLPDRATIANMAPEYGATMGYFPVDEATCAYLSATGRTDAQVDAVRAYYTAQGMFGIPASGQCDYSTLLKLDLATVSASVAGPKRPQDRIELGSLGHRFSDLLQQPVADGGFGKTADDRDARFAIGNGDGGPLSGQEVGNGDVVIAAITSCTNTSNPSVMLAAGLLAKKAVERGLTVRPTVKTSLGPGSRVVTDYLTRTGLQTYLDKLGFETVGYGCTTCIGNSGPLESHLESEINDHHLVVASVLSGNRNFEARIHQAIRANFLMSPPLVVAFALAGTVLTDLSKDPVGTGSDGTDVMLADIWPTLDEIAAVMNDAMDPATFRRLYSNFADQNPLWNEIPAKTGAVYDWDVNSTYIQEPPFF
ncbi:MAG TPA: aconitate hydratase AcnA, partial [Blastocatellia bacterium]|nr:aconitate hydratase AcnA [Blastocatellia bacterium]